MYIHYIKVCNVWHISESNTSQIGIISCSLHRQASVIHVLTIEYDSCACVLICTSEFGFPCTQERAVYLGMPTDKCQSLGSQHPLPWTLGLHSLLCICLRISRPSVSLTWICCDPQNSWVLPARSGVCLPVLQGRIWWRCVSSPNPNPYPGLSYITLLLAPDMDAVLVIWFSSHET